jgi:4'-phosphopantetheinyl transferase
MTSLETNWGWPPPNLTLTDDEVHLWRVNLAQPVTLIQQLRQCLSEDELVRADRFHFEKDRHHYLVGRSSLRLILGRYLNVEAGQLRFSYTAYGKPLLASPSSLKFNVSHAGEIALHAVTRNREVGVDIEKVRVMPDAVQIAERFFSTQENKVFASIPAQQKEEAFFNCWTRKEAYIKAIGEGLSHPLDTFDVSLKPGEPAALLRVKDAPQAVERWSLHPLDPGPGYVAALVVAGHNWHLKCWDWAA